MKQMTLGKYHPLSSMVSYLLYLYHTFIIHSYLSYVEKKTLLDIEANRSSGSSPTILSATWHQGWQQQYWSRMALKLQELNFTRRKKLIFFSCFFAGGGSNIFFCDFICSCLLCIEIVFFGAGKVERVEAFVPPRCSVSYEALGHFVLGWGWPYIILSSKLGSSLNERRLGEHNNNNVGGFNVAVTSQVTAV